MLHCETHVVTQPRRSCAPPVVSVYYDSHARLAKPGSAPQPTRASRMAADEHPDISLYSRLFRRMQQALLVDHLQRRESSGMNAAASPRLLLSEQTLAECSAMYICTNSDRVTLLLLKRLVTDDAKSALRVASKLLQFCLFQGYPSNVFNEERCTWNTIRVKRR